MAENTAVFLRDRSIERHKYTVVNNILLHMEFLCSVLDRVSPPPFFKKKRVIFLWSFSHNRLMIGLTIKPGNAEATFVQSTRTQRLLKTIYKLCYVGIHWIALAELYQMSTNVPGFQSFLTFLNYFIFVQISHQQKRG